MLLAITVAGQAHAISRYGGTSTDGSRVFFDSADQLVAADEDNFYDMYERSGGEVTLLSTGPAALPGAAHNAQYAASSADGTKVIFITTEGLVSADSDTTSDVYMRSGGNTTLLSGGTANKSVVFQAASVDAGTVYFESGEQMLGDGDDAVDVFRWTSGGTSLMTPGVTENAFFSGSTPDGAHVYFRTTQPLGGDVEANDDIFEGGSSITWISRGSIAEGGGDSSFEDVSDDGTKVFFTTTEALEPADDDDEGTSICQGPLACKDVYQRTAGGSTLISTGPIDTRGPQHDFVAASSDGNRVFFNSAFPMTAGEDNETSQGNPIEYDDVYLRVAGTTTLATPGTLVDHVPFASISNDGTKVLFGAKDRLSGQDTDNVTDVYQRSGGTTTLISQGPAGGNGNEISLFAGSSADGSTVFFETREQLTADDTEDPAAFPACFAPRCTDVYARTGATTTLISEPGPGATSANEASEFAGSNPNGTHAFFETTGSLVGADTDTFQDAYGWFAGSSFLLQDVGASPPDTDPPQTTITKKPKASSSNRTPTFEFRSDEAGSTFTCELDGRTRGCDSPYKTKRLAFGNHRFKVYATDAAGNDDETPAKDSFEVVR